MSDEPSWVQGYIENIMTWRYTGLVLGRVEQVDREYYWFAHARQGGRFLEFGTASTLQSAKASIERLSGVGV